MTLPKSDVLYLCLLGLLTSALMLAIPAGPGTRLMRNPLPLAGIARLPQVLPAGTTASPSAAEKRALQTKFGKLPLYFIENRGQVDDRAAFYLQSPKGIVYFTPTGVTFVLAGGWPQGSAP